MKQLAKLEQNLPAVLKKTGVPQAAALVLLAVSVFGVGGAKLAGYYSGTMAGFTTGKYSITADLDQRVSAAANVVTVAKKITGVDQTLLAAAEEAVNALSAPLGPADTYAANETLDAAVEALYDAALPLADDTQKDLLGEQHSEFMSRGTILRNSPYNEEAEQFNKDRNAFPASLIGALWGVDEAEYFA